MIKAMIYKWWKKRRVRRAQELHAYWKAGRETLEARLQSDWYFRSLTYYQEALIEAAAKEAMYQKRAEVLLQELNRVERQ